LAKLTGAPSVCCGVNVTAGALPGCRAGAFRWTLWARFLDFFGRTLAGCDTTIGVD
jgi:hypothetical protein